MKYSIKYPLIATALLAAFSATGALAGDDCRVPRARWQPREAVMQAAKSHGWQIDRIKADNGCWEVKGRDAEDRRIKAKLDPATLKVVKLRHRDGDHDRKRDAARRGPAAGPAAPPANPLFQGGVAPVVRVN